MLSLSKLEKILLSKGFIVNKYFIIDNLCVYLEVLSTQTASSFYLYIPSKYKFPIEDKGPVYKLKYVDINEEIENIAQEYAEQPENKELEKVYTEVDLDLSPSHAGDIRKHLEDKYKKNISVEDVSKSEAKNIQDMIRQLRRLKFCVESTRYKVAIVYRNYICAIRRDDDLEFFRIKKYPKTNEMRFFVTADLELVYEKLDSLQRNITVVKDGIYTVLTKNQLKHTTSLSRLLEQKDDMQSYIIKAMKKQEKYVKYLEKLRDMLIIINNKEKELGLNIREKSTSNTGNQSLHLDIQRSYETGKLEGEMDKVRNIKDNILKMIAYVSTLKENSALSIDKIMFDNQVMLYQIFQNFTRLAHFAE